MLFKLLCVAVLLFIQTITITNGHAYFDCYLCRHEENIEHCLNISYKDLRTVQCYKDQHCGIIHLTVNGVEGLERDCYTYNPCEELNERRGTQAECEMCNWDYCNGSVQMVFNSIIGIICLIVIPTLKHLIG